ncbi:hypothetical protein BJF79_07305 [Actinomadura sp. CNU-125]|uniref:hypothetical protein n=1 Tax=Actinomadura sp. CNU-125 TaxID=1904961 RepID=UPI0009591466|nr:hypothetical protein [Actinomadura sp. CNU-125]OLT34369.1 hypothetical protein BJF79_07305 [Actinomadura sp. CNU-125]
MPIYQQDPTCLPSTMGDIRPAQIFWSGQSWDYAVAVDADDAAPDIVNIRRRTPVGLQFTTSYLRGRTTAVKTTAA